MIVAIPEGLPLAVSIAMALSISKLKKDEILIKNLESIQSAGHANKPWAAGLDRPPKSKEYKPMMALTVCSKSPKNYTIMFDIIK